MAVRRSQNFLNQQRVDVPHLRSIESAVRNDFDELLAGLCTGLGKSYILNGFKINMTGSIGSSATGLQVIVAESAVLHGNSLESGTFFVVPATAPNETLSSTVNPHVEGSFTPGANNYVGLELTRQVDDGTTAQVYFWNPTTSNEFTKTVPLAETFDYKFVITSSIWAANVLPLSIVETDSANNVLKIDDSRALYHRLGTAGSATPDPTYSYNWTQGRAENFYSSTSSASSPFEGGDKAIKTEKEWKDAVMSMFKEVKGTTFWYSPNSGGSIVSIRSDIANMMMTGKGNISHSAGVAGRLNWSEDIYLNFIGSRLSYKLAANPATTHITLSDNQVLYMTLVRGRSITPALIFTNGSSIVSSVGSVSWTNDVLAGDFIKLASADDTKYYEILSVNTASQVTLKEVYAQGSTGAGGAQAQYAWGTYSTNAAPSTDRHLKIADREDVPFDQDTYWLFLRQDNGGSVARVYVRGSGGNGEIEQGESKDVSDTESQQVLEYIGSPGEAISTPDYSGAVAPAVNEEFTVTLPAAAAVSSGQHMTAYSTGDASQHYFWINKDGGGGDPLIPSAFGHAIPVTTGDTNLDIAATFQSVVDALSDFDAVDNGDGTVTVTLAQPGSATDAANVDIGGLSVVVDVQGSGSANQYITDGESLTRSIKRLDSAIAGIVASVTEKGYEENIDIVAGAPADDNELTGPIVAGTNITIPLNSRNSDVQQAYVVGAGTLAVYLNGVRLYVGIDYTEVGAPAAISTEIQLAYDLEVTDILVFKIEGKGVGTGGGGGSYTASNLGAASDADVFKQIAGTNFQFRRLTAGTNITITQNANDIVISSSAGVGAGNVIEAAVDYSMTGADDAGVADTASNDVTFTLPDANTVQGKKMDFKKTSASNTMFIKSVSGQLLDGVDIDAVPLAVTAINESVTILASAGRWLII
jgi:hypothetical protein